MMGNFFQDNDIVISETGTSSFGMIQTPLPKGAINVSQVRFPLSCLLPSSTDHKTFPSQVLWGSIGYTGGATLGALLAAEESKVKRRTILFIGDGSLQLTVQEIATMLRLNLKPIIVVLYVSVPFRLACPEADSSSFFFKQQRGLRSFLPFLSLSFEIATDFLFFLQTIEKLINGPTAKYNDIPLWKWQSLLDLFNAYEEPIPTKSWLAKNRGELEEILANKEFAAADKIQLLEVKMDKLDAPEALKKQGKLVCPPFSLSLLS
jgi:pyruvate decarboxylase